MNKPKTNNECHMSLSTSSLLLFIAIIASFLQLSSASYSIISNKIISNAHIASVSTENRRKRISAPKKLQDKLIPVKVHADTGVNCSITNSTNTLHN